MPEVPGGAAQAAGRQALAPGLQLMHRLGDHLTEPGGASLVHHGAVADGLIGDEHRGGERLGAEEGEQRAELILHHQRMPVASAGREQADGDSGEAGVFEEIDEMF